MVDAGMVGYRFNTIGVSDAISMGTDGMSFSLQSRDLIADSVETVMGAQVWCPQVSAAHSPRHVLCEMAGCVPDRLRLESFQAADKRAVSSCSALGLIADPASRQDFWLMSPRQACTRSGMMPTSRFRGATRTCQASSLQWRVSTGRPSWCTAAPSNLATAASAASPSMWCQPSRAMVWPALKPFPCDDS